MSGSSNEVGPLPPQTLMREAHCWIDSPEADIDQEKIVLAQTMTCMGEEKQVVGFAPGPQSDLIDGGVERVLGDACPDVLEVWCVVGERSCRSRMFLRNVPGPGGLESLIGKNVQQAVVLRGEDMSQIDGDRIKSLHSQPHDRLGIIPRGIPGKANEQALSLSFRIPMRRG